MLHKLSEIFGNIETLLQLAKTSLNVKVIGVILPYKWEFRFKFRMEQSEKLSILSCPFPRNKHD